MKNFLIKLFIVIIYILYIVGGGIIFYFSYNLIDGWKKITVTYIIFFNFFFTFILNLAISEVIFDKLCEIIVVEFKKLKIYKIIVEYKIYKIMLYTTIILAHIFLIILIIKICLF